MVSDEAASEVLRRLEQVPLLIAMTLRHLAKPDGDASPLAAWMAAYMALDTLDNEVGGLIGEAREVLEREGWVRPAAAVNTGSNSAVGE